MCALFWWLGKRRIIMVRRIVLVVRDLRVVRLGGLSYPDPSVVKIIHPGHRDSGAS